MKDMEFELIIFCSQERLPVEAWVLVKAVCLFLAAQTQNNHTETILFKTLLGPLALASYWLTLTHNLTHFY